MAVSLVTMPSLPCAVAITACSCGLIRLTCKDDRDVELCNRICQISMRRASYMERYCSCIMEMLE